MYNYLNNLNTAQRKAVELGITDQSAKDDPLLIIAGAGIGKTNTLAYRVAHLIHNGVDPQRILLLTFTRRASEEMIKRSMHILAKANKQVQKKGGNALSHVSKVVWAGTFHSIANRLLRIYADAIKIDSTFTVKIQGWWKFISL